MTKALSYRKNKQGPQLQGRLKMFYAGGACLPFNALPVTRAAIGTGFPQTGTSEVGVLIVEIIIFESFAIAVFQSCLPQPLVAAPFSDVGN